MQRMFLQPRLIREPKNGQKVAGVSMLGVKDEIKWSQGDEGLTLSVPKDKPCKHAYVYKIDLKK